MNAPTVFSNTAARLPQPQELHTSGLNTPVVTRQGLLSGWKQGTPKCHSGTDHRNILNLYSTTFVCSLPHTQHVNRKSCPNRIPGRTAQLHRLTGELYQGTRLAAGQCFTSSVPFAEIHRMKLLLARGRKVLCRRRTWVFLVDFVKIEKKTNVNFFMSVCFSVCLSVPQYGTTRLLLDGFSWNWMFHFFSEICRENREFVKI